MSEQTRITTPFQWDSTAHEVIAGIDLSGKRAVVTGSSSGIGIETARELAGAGADVTLAVRDMQAGARVAADIESTTGRSVAVGHLDLISLPSVAEFVRGWSGPLDLLINNAGVMALPELQLTPAGQEVQFAVNHLGHFALTVGLHDALAAASGGARIVSLSSRGHLRSPVVFDDLAFASREYEPFTAYGQSKTANILLAVEADRRWAGEGIRANAVHPGRILETNLTRHLPPEVLEGLPSGGAFTPKTLQQGASTTVLVATSALVEGIGGRYFEDCNEAAPAEFTDDPSFVPVRGVADYALSPENAARLWEVSEQLIAA